MTIANKAASSNFAIILVAFEESTKKLWTGTESKLENSQRNQKLFRFLWRVVACLISYLHGSFIYLLHRGWMFLCYRLLSKNIEMLWILRFLQSFNSW